MSDDHIRKPITAATGDIKPRPIIRPLARLASDHLRITPEQIENLRKGWFESALDIAKQAAKTAGASEEDAKDISGEAVQRFLECVKKGQDIPSPSSFIARIAIRKAQDFHRLKLRRPSLSDVQNLDQLASAEKIDAQVVNKICRVQALTRIGRRLAGDKKFLAWKLHVVDGWSRRQIAEHMATPEETVKSWISRAKKALANDPDLRQLKSLVD